jgi:NAD+ diphosphatase
MTALFDDRPFREASHRNGFSGNRIARWSEGRDDSSLERALAAPSSRLYLFAGDKVVLRQQDAIPSSVGHIAPSDAALLEAMGADADSVGGRLLPLWTLAEAADQGLDPDTVVLLGVRAGEAVLAGTVPPREERPPHETAIDLRSLAVQEALPPDDMGALAQARSLLLWHAANRFCARCGGPMRMKNGGSSRVCTVCNTEVFPRVDPVVIMLAVDGDRCLMGRQPQFDAGRYSALAGFLEPGETIEDAVRREIKEESGITVGRVRYHSSQVWPFPSSLMIGCHAEALSTEVVRDAAELEDCRWFEREEVAQMLAGTHPEGLTVPPRMAIAWTLIDAFAGREG